MRVNTKKAGIIKNNKRAVAKWNENIGNKIDSNPVFLLNPL
jgi:hypothetical protein